MTLLCSERPGGHGGRGPPGRQRRPRVGAKAKMAGCQEPKAKEADPQRASDIPQVPGRNEGQDSWAGSPRLQKLTAPQLTVWREVAKARTRVGPSLAAHVLGSGRKTPGTEAPTDTSLGRRLATRWVSINKCATWRLHVVLPCVISRMSGCGAWQVLAFWWCASRACLHLPQSLEMMPSVNSVVCTCTLSAWGES